MKKISVVLPTYNRDYSIRRSAESVLSQSYPISELIIVDDGSTDETRKILEEIRDDRIRYYYTEMNRGASAARNYGISKVSEEADYVAFQDSDDKWLEGKLEKQMSEFEKDPEIGFCYHKIGYRMSDGHLEIVPDEAVPTDKKQGDIYAQLLNENLVGCPTLVIKKAILDKVGAFDEELRAWEDYDLALRLAKGTKAAFIDEVLLEATLSDGGVSGSAGNYMMACCMVARKYRDDLLKTGTFNHRIEAIIKDAEKLGMKDQIVALLEKLLSS